MAGTGRFARSGDSAVGIAVEHDGIIGLFCLAVNPAQRRQGLGRKLVLGLLAGIRGAGDLLQVLSGNEAAIRLYSGLGFCESYRIATASHQSAPLRPDSQPATRSARSLGGRRPPCRRPDMLFPR